MNPRALAVLAVLAAGPPPAGDGARAADAGPWAEGERVAVRLIAASPTVGEATAPRLGVQFRMDDGWKIYWRTPGDAGYPPRFDWSGSDNLERAAVRWPLPERFAVAGFETLGYAGEVVLPLDVQPRRPGAALGLRARLDYMTCKELCIPVEAELSLDMPAGTAEPGEHAHLIARFAARVPGDGVAVGLTLERAAFAGDAKTGRLVVTARADPPFAGSPDLLVEGPPELVFARPRVALSEDRRQARLEVAVEGLEWLSAPLPGRALTLTLVDGARAAERAMTVEAAGPAAPAAAPAPAPRGWLAILGLALLGGLILNLMPCVLPVLSLKLMGAVALAGAERRAARAGFLASAAGIVASFLILAGALAGLKAAGAAVGWGIQFQQPWFLGAMAVVVALFAANLWGLFEVRLPAWASALGGRGRAEGLGGHFLSGAFAALLATPCSAPFVGTAVGFALAGGTAEIVAVFAALGTGLAAPHLLVAAFPALARALPRPGRWMGALRKVLAIPLAGTAGWLLWLLAAQIGPGTGAVPPPGDAQSPWRPFDAAAIPALVAGGAVVFVDVTADWCVTCQVNKRFALSDGAARARLSAPGVVAMRADWTRPDPAITRYLAGFQRHGIPFNAVYGPAAPAGRALPELLTPGLVVEALDAAARPR